MTLKASKQHITALHLYFPAASRAKVTRFWHHLSPPVLAYHLLNVARRANIKQAMLRSISAVYLPGQRLSHHHPEL